MSCLWQIYIFIGNLLGQAGLILHELGGKKEIPTHKKTLRDWKLGIYTQKQISTQTP